MTDPVVEAQVLTALDFDTPPVEVMEPPVYKSGEWFVDPAILGKITWSPIEEYTVSDEVLAKPAAPTFKELEASIAKMFQTTMSPCGCTLCRPRHTGPMNRRAKDLWVRALRSRQYPQGRGALRQGDKRCALGVLIEVAMQDGVRLSMSVNPEHGSTGYDGNFGALPIAVMEWAGLRDTDPAVGGMSIAMMNDSGVPFEALADRIEVGL
jgi:hypothetical protein